MILVPDFDLYNLMDDFFTDYCVVDERVLNQWDMRCLLTAVHVTAVLDAPVFFRQPNNLESLPEYRLYFLYV